jgi:predicted TIM-barrel fold metal-dependent hydrolase
MAYSISIIQNADYLTPEQKRDILYNNAARFLRLDATGPNSPGKAHP